MYLSKITIFFDISLHSMPPLGGRRRNIAIPFVIEILRLCGYPTVKKVEDICNRFDRIPACDRQTNRQTDRQTSCNVNVKCKT